MRALALLLALSACAASAPKPTIATAKPVVASKPFIFIGTIDVKSTLGKELRERVVQGKPLALALHTGQADAVQWSEIAKRTGVAAPASDTFKFTYAGYPTSSDPATAAQKQPSFVIDYDEPSVVAVHDEIAKQSQGTPTMDALTRFVDKLISDKNMQRNFDVASRVASHKEGDCSEHAVLLAALGRSFGYATRVVLGVVFTDVEGSVGAFGHAWVEYLGAEDKTWRLADATTPPDMIARYIPLAVLEDEGPAFARRMIEDVGVLLMRDISMERP